MSLPQPLVSSCRENIFEDAFAKLSPLKREALLVPLQIKFAGEEGYDMGGLLREFYYKLSSAMLNVNFGLFKQSNVGSETYQPNPQSKIHREHLQYFQFCGRIVAKAIIDNQLLDCRFTRTFYKQILGTPVSWRDIEAVDQAQYQSLNYVLENDIEPVCWASSLLFRTASVLRSFLLHVLL
jgi:E3 ubiquitin-protein ligase HUWE1